MVPNTALEPRGLSPSRDSMEPLLFHCFRSEGFCSSTIARFIPVPGLNGAFTVRDQIGTLS